VKISDTFIFEADQETVWKLLMDPDAIAKALPGVEKLTPVEGEDMAWQAAAKLEIASVSGTYSGFVRMSEIDPPNQYRLTVSGEGKQSMIDGTALLKLSYDPEKRHTILTWEAEAQIAGKLASVGQRLIGAAAAMLSKLFFRALAKQLPSET
jgi:uncharacterized protein